MTKEAPGNVPLGEFLLGDTEQWKRKWQDPNFTHSFPSNVQSFLSDDRHDQFLKEHGNTVIASAISAFMQLPWGPKDNESIAVNNMGFTKDGETYSKIKSGNAQSGDSLIKAEIASLLLLGFNPAILEATKNSLALGFGDLTYGRKANFRHNVFGLLTKNSSVRAWINTNKLDTLNGLVWDRDVTRYALSLYPAINNPETEPALHLPRELLNLESFAPDTIESFVDHMLDLSARVSKIKDRQKTASLFNYAEKFMNEVNQYREHTVPQEKLDRLYALINER